MRGSDSTPNATTPSGAHRIRRIVRLAGITALAACALATIPVGTPQASASQDVRGGTGRDSTFGSTVGGALTPQVPPTADRYWIAAADGGVFAFGGAQYFGSMAGQHLNSPVVGLAVDGPGFLAPSSLATRAPAAGRGYWEVAGDGGIFAFGAAPFLGSMGGRHLNAPVVGMTVDPERGGYYEVAADGGVFAFGGASFLGSMAGQALAAPIVSITATPDGGGYWLVGADGGVFAYGDATFLGSLAGTGGTTVGLAAQGDGGYWLAKVNGHVHNYGTAGDEGSLPATPDAPVVGITSTGGQGYWLTSTDGGVFAFGGAGYSGGLAGRSLNAPVVGISALQLIA